MAAISTFARWKAEGRVTEYDFEEQSRINSSRAFPQIESARREREVTTILGFLRRQMNGVVARRRTSMSLKERLGLRGLGCCGATWGFKPTTISVISDEEEALEQEREEIEVVNAGSNPTEGVSDPGCPAVTSIPASSGMNLAAALAAERQFREASIIVRAQITWKR
ncbi:hypothetical protein GH714_000325 [Hevea brasiliensis]|uniref:Uncharacterized protein n=1 Tax=Hevea brasiliensis TaxID=3981 RepID=A0A6A6M607_HEVBR|nr:hypothetical protein GH714_000325 [Hevea brasiliensis]